MAFLALAGNSIGQQKAEIYPAFNRYSIAEGLAQPQVRHVHVDETGYVWIGTQGGISGFDGSRVHTFEHQGTLSQEYIFSLLYCDSLLWGSTLDKVFRFDGKEVRYFNVYQDEQRLNVIVSHQDNTGTIWFWTGWKHFTIANDSIQPVRERYPALDSFRIKFIHGSYPPGKTWIIDTRNRIFLFDSALNTIEEIESPFDSNEIVHVHKTGSYFKHPQSSTPELLIFNGERNAYESIYTIRDKRLVKVVEQDPTTGQFIQTDPKAPACLVSTPNEKFSILVAHDGKYRFHPELVFEQLRFVANHDNKAYLTTDEGFIVIHLNGLENVDIGKCDYPWSVTAYQDDQALVGCYKGGLFRINKEGTVLKHFPLNQPGKPFLSSRQILSNSALQDNILYAGSNGGFNICDLDGTWVRHFATGFAVEAFVLDSRRNKVLAANDKILAYDPAHDKITSFVQLPVDILGQNWVNDLAIEDDSVYWAACSKGIVRMTGWKGMMASYTAGNDRLDCMGAISLEFDVRGQLWVGGTCGLMAFNPDEDRFEQVLPELMKTRINQVLALPGDTLVCVSANQVTILDCGTSPPRPISVLQESNGINLQEPSENGIAFSGGKYIWMPSNSGIQRLNLSQLDPEVEKPQFRIYGINDQPMPLALESGDCFRVQDRYALVDLSVVDHLAREWQYRYRVNNQAFSPWQSTNEILVSGLVHGKNDVIIQANWLLSDPVREIEKRICIRTHVPFILRASTRNLFFLAFIFLAIIVFLVFLRYQRTQRKMNTLRTELYQNRLRTIQAYFNPHFLFNALTTLQDYILHHDRKESSRMVVKLSNIFRKVLHSGVLETPSKVPMIPLSEEIGFIQDMVELQNKQFTHPVLVQIDLDTEIEKKNPLVPPMLIQPFVENAFKHAFPQDGTNKIIRVSVEQNGKDLMIRIRDNGIGMENGRPTENSTFLGLKLAKERMELLKSLGIRNQINIEKKEPHGTQVNIKIEEYHESNHR